VSDRADAYQVGPGQLGGSESNVFVSFLKLSTTVNHTEDVLIEEALFVDRFH
jgi:hypothetical protein